MTNIPPKPKPLRPVEVMDGKIVQSETNLAAKDVVDFGKEVGRETVKQAFVWTAAAFLTKKMRHVFDKLMKK